LQTEQKTESWPYYKFTVFVVAGILVLTKGDGFKYSHGPADFAMFVGFIVFVGWLLLPRRDKPAGHEGTDQGFALRLGKSLKRVLRPLKG